MGVAISGAGVAPAIAESIELFDVAEGRASLLRDEGPERDLESAMKQGIKFAGGQAHRRTGRFRHGKDERLVLARGDNRRGEANRQRQAGAGRMIFFCEAHGP